MFGGHIDVDHVRGGLTVGRRGGEGTMRMRAWPRIAILVQQLRCVYGTLSPPRNDKRRNSQTIIGRNTSESAR